MKQTNSTREFSEAAKKSRLKCTIKGFWAKSRPDLCALFIEGHEKILNDHGLQKLISTDDYWLTSEDVYVVLALDEIGQPIGGIRLERKTADKQLPLVSVLKPFEPNIEEYINALNYESLFEACGLWNAKEAAGNELGIFLCRVCVAVSTFFGIDAILSLNGVYTYYLPKDMGSKIIKEIGENGLFKYPIARFHSALWIQNDLQKMSLASPECITRVNSLRKDGNQEALEENNKNGLKVQYDIVTKEYSETN